MVPGTPLRLAALSLLAMILPMPAPAQIQPATRPATPPAAPHSWTADNGNGTYSNPLFYDEFSDPDVIRVGTDYYLAGTTNHAMPGLVILHSKDLVNWEFASYCADRLDFGPKFALKGGDIYGGGIWAPCLRYSKGWFYVFSNINGVGTQVYRSQSPNGPWRHNALKTTLYDLGVLFDDDGKIWAFHGTEPIYLTQLNADLTDVVPNTRRLLIPAKSGMGEGLHAYKIKGKYYLLSAIPGAHTNVVCARADTLDGPWTVEPLTDSESLGVPTDPALKVSDEGRRFEAVRRDPNLEGGLTIHQGGIVDTPSGQWWSILMQDHGAVGRLSTLVPITWTDGWPLVGLPGNLRKAPVSWVKPDVGPSGADVVPRPTYARSDEFDAPKLQPIWQWNHAPDDAKWSLTEKPGTLRLHALPADDFFAARNTLTQRAVGPQSTVTVELDAKGMKAGDVAGLALLNYPYAFLGAAKSADGLVLRQYDQSTDKTVERPLDGSRVWLRAACDFDASVATFSCSRDGKAFEPIGEPFVMLFQLRTFQGIRYSLFNFSTAGPAGYADFDHFTVDEPHPGGMTAPIPHGRRIALTSRADGNVLTVRGDHLIGAPAADKPAADAAFRVVEAGPGRVSLQAADGRFLSVAAEGGAVTLKSGPPGEAETFQWVDLRRGDLMLMSLATHRYLSVAPDKSITADARGPRPDHRGGATFGWKAVGE